MRLVICWRIIFFNGLDNFYYYLWCLACLPSSSLMTSDGKIVISYHSICNFQGTYGNFRYLMEMEGFEPLTPCLQGRCSPNWATPPYGLPLDIQFYPMGLSGLEPPTSRLSGVRSNRLSYKPILIWHPPAFPYRLQYSIIGRLGLNHRVRDVDGCFP